MKSFLNTQTGFSITSSLIGIGLMGAAAVGFMKFSENMNKGQVTTQVRMESLEVERVIVSTLMDKGACGVTFRNKKIGDPITEVKSASGQTIYKVGSSDGSETVKIAEMTTRLKTPLSPGNSLIDFVVRVEKLKTQAYSQPRNLIIPVNVTENAGIITDCFVNIDQIVKTVCESLGGVFDGIQCRLPSCSQGFVLQGISPDGRAQCVPTLSGKSCGPTQYMSGVDVNGNPICSSPQGNSNPPPPNSSQPTDSSGGSAACPKEMILTWSEGECNCGSTDIGTPRSYQHGEGGTMGDSRNNPCYGSATFVCNNGALEITNSYCRKP